MADAFSTFLEVTRGPRREIYRLRFTEDGACALERFTGGDFGPPRIFRGGSAARGAPGFEGGFDQAAPDGPEKRRAALRYVGRYLNGAVNVGERDLLSPTSALARNVRWFPGDIQMIKTAFPYAGELFPAAQFHIAQLFRRVFGDVAFLALIAFTSAYWLQVRPPLGHAALAILLQVVSLVAIIGFDRYWEPLRYAWRAHRQHPSPQNPIQALGHGAFMLAWLVITGTGSALLTTIIGLANLAIHPLKILESWRRVSEGKTLEWRASSVSAGQDMRGWPVGEFFDTFRPATKLGVVVFFAGLWLTALGAPLGILGLTGLGVFVVAFLTAPLFAWYAALPTVKADGASVYRMTPGERRALTAGGAAWLGVSYLLWRRGAYPMPATERSLGVVALFLSASALFALGYPHVHGLLARSRLSARADADGGRPEAVRGRPLRVAGVAAAVALLVVVPWLLFGGRAADGTRAPLAGVRRVLHADEAAYRMPIAERRVYATIGSAMRGHGTLDSESLLTGGGGGSSEPQVAPTIPDLRELHGAPAPFLPRLAVQKPLEVAAVHAAPLDVRLSLELPERVLPPVPPESAPAPSWVTARDVAQDPVVAARDLDAARTLGDRWARAYPALGPDLGGGPGKGERALAGSPVAQAVRYLRKTGADGGGEAALAQALRLDYLNAYWDAPEAAPHVERSFHDRVRRDLPGERGRLAIDWQGDDARAARWDTLTTEQRLGALVWRFGAEQAGEATPAQLRAVVEFVERALAGVEQGGSPLASALLEVATRDGASFEGRSGEGKADLLAQRLWSQVGQGVPGRLGRVVARAAAGRDLPGSEDDRALVRAVAERRFTGDEDDAQLARLHAWLVLVDPAETYREVAAGYDGEAREFETYGGHMPGLARAADLPEGRVTEGLLTLWREIPRRFPRIPARDPQVSEVLATALSLSTSDGRSARTARRFLEDFADVLSAVNASMGDTPPARLENLARDSATRAYGAARSTAEGDRFLAWFAAGLLANATPPGGALRKGDLRLFAEELSRVVNVGGARWPHLPFDSPSFTGSFVRTLHAQGGSLPALFGVLGSQLDEAERLAARHLAPNDGYVGVIELRARARSGLATFDPAARTGNAWLSLAQLEAALHRNGIHREGGNAAALADAFAQLHELARRSFPLLAWDSEGVLEAPLLSELAAGWDARALVRRFQPEWSLASALLAGATGFEERFEAAAAPLEHEPNEEERRVRAFVDLAALRGEEATGLRRGGVRAQATLAAEALASLVLAAAEEGALPVQQGVPWTKAQARTWAASLRPGDVAADPPLQAWALSMVADAGGLLLAMREEGPHFPWHQGPFVETTVLAMRNAGASVASVRAGLAGAWKGASLLRDDDVKLPPSFVELVKRDAQAEFDRQVFRARKADGAGGPEADAPLLRLFDEPAVASRLADFALADVMAQVRAQYGVLPAPLPLARQIVEVRTQGPQRFELLPWAVSGFTPALVVAAQRPEFGGDFWRYAKTAELPRVNDLLQKARARAQGAQGGPGSDGASPLDAGVLDDVRQQMRTQNGRTPASDDVVVFQALRDGVSLLTQFFPKLPVTLDRVTTLVRLRTAIRRLSESYRNLPIAAPLPGDVGTARVAFPERLAAVAFKQGLEAGLDPAQTDFVPRATGLLEGDLLGTMNRIYDLVRKSLSPDEIETYARLLQENARDDTRRRAATLGMVPARVSLPRVMDDDVVADFALYEILYAGELGRSPSYLEDLFDLVGRIRARADFAAAFKRGLSAVDARYPDLTVARVKEGDPRAATWLAERSSFLKAYRGRVVALARTFALVKREGFSAAAEPDARQAFARFGRFDDYFTSFFDDLATVGEVPELGAQLDTLEREDPSLADGVQFAVALFKRHVLDFVYPDPRESRRALFTMAAFLPTLADDYQRTLGFAPRLESGVPLYDARRAFGRALVQPGPGNEVFRRIDMMQRGLQGWPEAYVLKQAYKLLFDKDLDEDDREPAPMPKDATLISRARGVISPRTRGDEVTEFLTKRVPATLALETGTHDLAVWVDWLAAHGEVGLDGDPTGKNPYADDVASFRARLAHYAARVDGGLAAGKNVRPEQQRIRDLDRDLHSLERQVSWLRETASHVSQVAAPLAQNYRVAVDLHGVVAILALVLIGAAGAVSVRRFAARSVWVARVVRALTVVVPLSLATVLPVILAASADAPEGSRLRAGAGHFAPLGRALGYLDAEGRPRGAAAQLRQSRPWEVLTGPSQARTGEASTTSKTSKASKTESAGKVGP